MISKYVLPTIKYLFFTFYFFTCTASTNAQSTTKPNIILITTDQQSADAMSYFMGKKWINTPNMDALAAKGVVFKNAYVANPICGPSRNCIITGLYPHTTKIEGNKELSVVGNPNQKNTKWSGAEFKSMGTYFKEAGYETAYFGKWHLNYDPKDTNAHGFDNTAFTTENGKDAELPNAVNNFLAKKHSQPFLLFVSILNPHNICEYARFQNLPDGPIGMVPNVNELPPLKTNTLPPQNESDAMSLIRKSYQNNLKLFPVGNYTSDDWRRLAWGYYRLLEKTDSIVGQILSAITTNGWDKNTLIVFTSDHGESLGAHLFNQKTVFYEESAKVPFILKYDGILKHDINQSLINTGVDLLPTILDFAKIRKPASLPGSSLKKVAQLNKKNQRPYIVVQNKMEQGGLVDGEIPIVIGRMVRSERYKYSLYDTLNNREELYDLTNDPGETINIASQKNMQNIVRTHRKYLKHFGIQYEDLKALNMLESLIH